MFQRLDGKPAIITSSQIPKQPASAPDAPVALPRSVSAPNLKIEAPQAQPPTQPTQSISIAGIATAPVIMSNLAPTVSAEDIKASLGNMGGGVKEVHIISSNGQSIQVRVHFKKPVEGGQECISRFNGVIADGTYLPPLQLLWLLFASECLLSAANGRS